MTQQEQFEQWAKRRKDNWGIWGDGVYKDLIQAFAAGQAAERERIKKLWPSQIEIGIGHDDNGRKTWGSEYNPQVWESAISWLRERLGLE